AVEQHGSFGAHACAKRLATWRKHSLAFLAAAQSVAEFRFGAAAQKSVFDKIERRSRIPEAHRRCVAPDDATAPRIPQPRRLARGAILGSERSRVRGRG